MPAWAEGSRDMYPAGAPGNRGHIVWQSGSAGGALNRTLLRVFANAGENILVGSSAVGVGSGDIKIFSSDTVTGTVANEILPSTANFECMEDRTDANQGFIATRAEELAGPTSVDGTGNAAGYEPCVYEAPVTGIYYVAMYGPSGANSDGSHSDSPNDGVEHSIGAINTGDDQRTGISAWDVTVRSNDPSSVQDINGRLHTFFINKTMGENGFTLHSDLYPVTVDGYRYRVDIRGLDPFGFRMFGNQLGNLDSDRISPLYRDVLGTNGDVDNPVGGTSSAPPQYPFFFNELDPAALPFIPVYDPISGVERGTGFSAVPIQPILDTASFTGNVSGNTSNIGGGGTFSFNSNLTGVYEIVISRDGSDLDPTNLNNRVLRGVMLNSGPQSITWNGRDNGGGVFPTGEFKFEVSIHAGEYHFPMSDPENNVSGGPTYTLLNATNPLGNSIAYYDHRGYRTVGGTDVVDGTSADPFNDALCGTNPPNPPATNPILGADSAAPGFNAFGQSSGGNTNGQCTGAFGDTKTLDLWTYLSSTPAEGDVVIIAPSTDYGDAPDTSDTNGQGNYSTLQANNGPVHGTSTSLFLGSAVTDDSDGFGEGTDDSGDATDDTDDAFTSLAEVRAGETYTLGDIPLSNTTGSEATLHAWIDFDQDGQFELSEYESATVASGDTTAELVWSIPSDAVSSITYARFRLTTDSLSDDSNTTDIDERSVGEASDGEVEDYQIEVALISLPRLLLTKRITAIDRGFASEQRFDESGQERYFNVGNNTDNDNEVNWPGPVVTANVGSSAGQPVESYIVGVTGADWETPIEGITVDPGGILEYTVSFLSAGNDDAQNVYICDRIPTHTTFDPTAFNSSTPAAAGPGDRGILLSFNGSDVALTNASDGDEIGDTDGNDNGIGGYYFPPSVNPNTELGAAVNCGGPNNNGAIVVDLSDVPNATGQGDPLNSFGYIRFRVIVD